MVILLNCLRVVLSIDIIAKNVSKREKTHKYENIPLTDKERKAEIKRLKKHLEILSERNEGLVSIALSLGIRSI